MIDMTQYGWNPIDKNNLYGETPARVTAVHRERYAVVCAHGETFARLKTSVYFHGGNQEFPTVGDFVSMEYNPGGDSQIVCCLPRRTFFSRRDPSPPFLEQAVAANFDTVLILQSLNQDFNVPRLERYITLSWQSGAIPVVVLTKADMTEDYGEQLRMAQQAAVGVEVLPLSAKTGFGMEALAPYLLPGKTLALLGSSGVGKSSLVNALAGEELMAVSAIREEDSRGRHTTTHRQLIRLPSGVIVIDTPGMRVLGMWDVTEGLGETFADVDEILSQCKYSNCTHDSEPGCAVRAALESGALPAARWKNYQNLKREARYSGRKGAAKREREQRHSERAKFHRRKEQGRRPSASIED